MGTLEDARKVFSKDFFTIDIDETSRGDGLRGMKKICFVLITTLLMAVVLIGCGSTEIFNGSKTGNDNRFDIEFKVLNASYSHDIKLQEGDSLNVSVDRQAGEISLLIQAGDEKPVYRGDAMESASFAVNISNSGVYTITVSGKKAKGHVVVEALRGAKEAEDAKEAGAENVQETPEAETTWKSAIDGLPEDFIFGMDASSVLVEENSGVKYYGFDGQEQDVFKTLSEAGVNYIRLRVWNDPYDENGNGYGGGNNDVPTAIELGKRATENGMKVCIDYHYSDFWADPKRQHAPKAWEGMDVEEKSAALYEFTKESLKQLLDAGVDVGMIQIGNEINYGMSGETKFDNVVTLLKAGSKAIREVSSEYGKEINIVVHYTRITDKADVLNLVSKLVDNELDFDMIGMSYYPFWDGSMENMSRVLELIQERYGKKVFLAETSYAYTTKDGDGAGNSFKAGDEVSGYEASVDGQASIIHDICEAVNNIGGLGIFYWEGTWIPVGPASSDNSSIWEKYGSGWASSFASDYDPEDAGLYYGGCSWDNQAFFDFEGHPLESINVFKYMKYGYYER